MIMKTIIVFLMSTFLFGCSGDFAMKRPRLSLFVGIDVSGSFYNSGQYEEAIDFLSYYLHGHLNEMGELKPLKSLFVGSIGGDTGEEVKSFRPIHDFQGKSVDKIKEDLKEWFPKSDALTDFSTFFKSVATISKKRNLSLAPITIMLVTDGLPDVPGVEGDAIDQVDLSELEYLSRNVTVRLLYPDPTNAHKWETVIPRKRVRMWTVDREVMQGWKNQLVDNGGPSGQQKLWKWIRDNIDFRVRRGAPVR
ncbi:hypothetical protein BVX98_06910 [bacterium F11]|nr:hypothetical protein BVX98_06910 [bacterium F11]